MITLASMGRFHFLEQARALQELRQLDRFYCDDPRVLGAVGVRRGRWLASAGCAARFGPTRLQWCGEKLASATASTRLVKINSAFALEALRARPDAEIWVDHGSLHERHVARAMSQEAAQCGDPALAQGGNHSSPEILDRQAEEFSRARRVVVASELARRTLVAEGVAPSKIRVVPLAVDSQRFSPAPAPGPKTRFRVLHAGPVSFNKGVHRLLAAFAAARLPEAELWMVGAASEPVRSRLAAQSRGLNVELRPPVRQSALPGLFAECDLFVLASLADGFGLTVLQAMACGLPAVVTDQCGCAEVLDGCPAVEIVAAGNTEALVQSLQRAHESWRLGVSARQELSRQARAWAARLTWRAHAERLGTAIAESAPARMQSR